MDKEYNYLYKIQPTRHEMLTNGPTAEEAKILDNHLAYLARPWHIKELFFSPGRTQTTDISGFGIVIFRADSEESALNIMNNDPAIKSGVMHSELFPYKIACLSKQDK